MKNNIQFKTDEYLSNSTVPVLILHAQDDRIIPSFLGKRVRLRNFTVPPGWKVFKLIVFIILVTRTFIEK